MRARHLFVTLVLAAVAVVVSSPDPRAHALGVEAAAQLCADTAIELNAPLCGYDEKAGYRVAALPSSNGSDSLFLILTFSGGGTRAAAFALGALTALRDIQLSGPKPSTLLDQVDVISSVSGGSFTSAFYGLFREKIFPACTTPECGDRNRTAPFYSRMLYRNIQKDLVLRALWPPTNVMRRSEFAAQLYSRTVFEDKTFAALMDGGHPTRPFILLNSTDIGMGRRFEFSQDQFDYLCSDLSRLRVGTAVGASAAFPVLLDTIPLHNYGWGKCGYSPPLWTADALQSFESNARRYEKAQYLMTFKEPGRRYVHLLDGGLTDNIGLRGPMEAIETDDHPGVGGWRLTEKMNNGKVDRVVVIDVDAKTIHPKDWDCCRQPPGFFTGIEVSTDIPHSHYSFETIELWREMVARRKSERQALIAAGEDASPLPEFYNITISFDSIPDSEEHDRTHLFELPTTFSLPQSDVDLLVSWGYRLVKTSRGLAEVCDRLGGCSGLDRGRPR